MSIGTFREWLRESELNEASKLTLREIKYAVQMLADKLLYGSNNIRKVSGTENKIVIDSKINLSNDVQKKLSEELSKSLEIDYEISEYKDYWRIDQYILTLIKKK